eukprot:6552644-Lingulodinium_polyedra.AAC.1
MKARGSEDDDMESPILVIKARKTKAVMAHLLPRKGADPYAVARVVQDIRNTGYKRIILKSDQEPSIMALKQEVKRISE